MLQEDRLSFPLTITRQESPDFRWQEAETCHGLEVVQATNERDQKAGTELERAPEGSWIPVGSYKVRGPDDNVDVPGLVEGDAERRWTQEIMDAIRNKTKKLQGYDAELRKRCHLLIYDDTEWSIMIGWYADELPILLSNALHRWRQSADPDWLHYRRISVVRNQVLRADVPDKGLLVLHDITGQPEIFATSRAASQLKIPHRAIADFCKEHGIRKLGFFGSIHEPERFGPGSDVDVLVEFQPEERVGLIRLAGIEIELSELVKRKVDLRSVPDLSKYFRHEVTRQKTELEYVARAS